MWVRVASVFVRRLPAGRYRLSHGLSQRPPEKFLMRMPKDSGGYLFLCDLRDIISREVCFTGLYEPQETAIVRSILRPGMTFVDVGANWGYFTLLAASLVGASGSVLSLEPDPRLFPMLEENLLRNCLEQVSALPVAAASGAGTLTLAGFDEAGENFGVSRLVTGSDTQQHLFQVRADSLDRLLESEKLASVDLMKMDIEGAETFAVAGMSDSLSTGRIKRLLLELHPAQLIEHGSSASNVIQILQDFGYNAWTIDHSPQATRQSAYKGIKSFKQLVRPFDVRQRLDAWPHLLWLAPGVQYI